MAGEEAKSRLIYSLEQDHACVRPAVGIDAGKRHRLRKRYLVGLSAPKPGLELGDRVGDQVGVTQRRQVWSSRAHTCDAIRVLLHVLRVFSAADGSGGNPLGVFLDGAAVPEAERQGVAHELGFSETVFVEDAVHGRIRIFTPIAELPFAGHPTVGTAWLLAQQGIGVEALHSPSCDFRVRYDGSQTWIAARPEWSPPFTYTELNTPSEVEALEVGRPGPDTYFWAWIDRERGLVRARGLLADHGIDEDEATGSAALALSAALDKEIEVRQGVGSVITARPLTDGWVEVGGETVLAEEREYSLAG